MFSPIALRQRWYDPDATIRSSSCAFPLVDRALASDAVDHSDGTAITQYPPADCDSALRRITLPIYELSTS